MIHPVAHSALNLFHPSQEEVIRTSEPRVWMADIKVDFDKTKHLTDEKIQKRKGKMEKYIRDEQEKAAKEQR